MFVVVDAHLLRAAQHSDDTPENRTTSLNTPWRKVMSAPKKLKKVSDAEELAKPCRSEKPTEEEKKLYVERSTRAIKIYKELCLSTTLTAEDKLEVVASFAKHIPDEGREMLIRWRDMFPFVSGKEKQELLKLLVGIAKSQQIDSHERTITAVNLFNRTQFGVCYGCFEAIAFDESVAVEYRVEAARYLFGSEEDDYRTMAQECLNDIIETMQLPSDYRYKVIAGFISKTGVASFLNKTKIKVPYDEEFVYGLQHTFFNNEKNDDDERILSGQHLLQMSEATVDAPQKIAIGDTLLAIAADTNRKENVRADAADVVLRVGHTSEQMELARKTIADLGYSAVDASSSNIMDRVKTIYTNSQNIHDEKISKTVATFIEKMVKDTSVRLRPFNEVHQEITDLVRSKNLETSKRFNAFKALNRVSVDTATFTSYRVTIAEILIHVWIRMQKYEGDVRALLDDRLVQELVDMGSTCSSGHSGRFVNVLSTVDSDLRITYDVQIVANVAGRLNAKIRDVPDQDLKASISMGMMPSADADDRDAYNVFIKTAIADVKKDMYNEFVGEGHVTDREFAEYFAKAAEQWVIVDPRSGGERTK